MKGNQVALLLSGALLAAGLAGTPAAAQGEAACGVSPTICATSMALDASVPEGPVPTAPASQTVLLTLTYTYDATGAVLADGDTTVTVTSTPADATLVVQPAEITATMAVDSSPGETGAKTSTAEVPLQVHCTADGAGSQVSLSVLAEAAANGGLEPSSVEANLSLTCAGEPPGAGDGDGDGDGTPGAGDGDGMDGNNTGGDGSGDGGDAADPGDGGNSIPGPGVLAVLATLGLAGRLGRSRRTPGGR